MIHSLVHSSIDNYPGLLLVNILLQKSVTSSKKKIKMRKKHILLMKNNKKVSNKYIQT